MTPPRELRKEMRRRRRELRSALPALRRQARARTEELPAVKRRKRRRRVRRTLTVVLLLLLLCLVRCDCQPPLPAPPAVKVEPPEPEPKPKAPPPVRAKRPPIRARTEPQPRGGFEAEARAAPNWLDDFRLQVAARSARLARCFTGAEKPGALRWTTSVNPDSGAVADHEIEPLGPGAELQGEQRQCVVQALANPAYKLAESQKQALPDRISLVIEF